MLLLLQASSCRNPSCTLPPELLALVLARLDPAERLGSMARVCSAWRTAAVIASNSISARGRVCWGRAGPEPSGFTQDKATALSGWLQAHAAAAALDSLEVTVSHTHSHRCPQRDFPTIQLPVQQLASLRSLDLERIKVDIQGAADTQAAPAVLPPELSGLTSLRLWRAELGLSTLPAFTNLQHLALELGNSSFDLSGLLLLTHLHLSHDCADDAVLASVSSLTCLQELHLGVGCYTDSGLAALPPCITKLVVGGDVTLAPNSTPAVAQLTALQWLEVNCAAGFSTAVLRSMSSLRHLDVQHTPLLAAAGDGDNGDIDLAVLNGLTQLQHLELPIEPLADEAAVGPEADVAALTASSQLTYLNIERLVAHQHYRKMFAEGRQLPKLKELHATMGVLGTADNAQALVRCCPNLERLEVSAG